jgi:DNA-binding NarL/FixJ family response regulator
MPKPALTPEQKLQVLEYHRLGCTSQDIADFVGCDKATVNRIIRAGAATMTPTDEVAELMSQDMTFPQIAQQLNMTLDAVKSAFKRIKRALGPQAR